jgi:hypothetical protein
MNILVFIIICMNILHVFMYLCIDPMFFSAKSRCLSCTDIEERVTQLNPRHLDVVIACLTESWLHAVHPPTLLLYSPQGSEGPSLLEGGNLQTDAAQLYPFGPIPAKEKKLGLLSVYKFSLHYCIGAISRFLKIVG